MVRVLAPGFESDPVSYVVEFLVGRVRVFLSSQEPTLQIPIRPGQRTRIKDSRAFLSKYCKTAVHGCRCPGDMAVRMGWVGLRVCHFCCCLNLLKGGKNFTIALIRRLMYVSELAIKSGFLCCKF